MLGLGNFASWSPDGVSLWSGPRATVGVGRLITTAQQGRVDRTAAKPDLLVAVDARFDDLESLRATLDADPESSDADLVVAGYRRWGADVVSQLRGEFALLIWDDR